MQRFDYPQIGESCYYERLDNGLNAFVISKPGYAKAMAMIAVSYGGMDARFTLNGAVQDTPEGIAHYLEHKMFDMREGSALTWLSQAGASANAFTAKDITAYHFTSTDRFPEHLRTLLRFVSTPYFTKESVDKERGIIGQEIRMYRDTPGHRVYENLLANLYALHPVRRSILGDEASIARITPETLYRLHGAFYVPENMVLVAVGDVDPRMVFDTARMTIRPGEHIQTERDLGAGEPEEALKESVREEMEVPEPTFLLGCKAIPFPRGEEGQRMSLLASIAAELLCGEGSPLYARLYEDGLIRKDFYAGPLDYPGAAMLVFGGDSPDPEAVSAAIFEETARLGREGADPERFRRILRSEYGGMVRGLNSFDSLCAQVVRGWFGGYDALDFPRHYASITLEETVQFLTDTVRRHRSCLSVVGPKKGGAE